MNLAMQWLGPFTNKGVSWSGQQHRWTFPSGATLTFGYLDGSLDKYRYQGTSYCYCGFDELTQFAEDDYRFLFGWLRKIKGVDVPLRMRSAGNPGGVGHAWVKKRFIDHETRGSRIFIPAKLEDNLNADRGAYEQSLLEMDYVTRTQLRYGDWSVLPKGKIFQRQWFKFVDCPPDQVPEEAEKIRDRKSLPPVRCRFWDCAATEGGGAFTVGALLSRASDGVFCVEDIVRRQVGPAGVQKIVVDTARKDGVKVKIRMEQEGGSSGKSMIALYMKILAGYDFKGVPATGEKSLRWRPFAVQAESGNVTLVKAAWNEPFLEELECVPEYPYKDQADAASGSLTELALNSRAPGDYGFS